MTENLKQIHERLSKPHPVSDGLRDCISEAARRRDLRALAFMNYENADNSDVHQANDNARLLRRQLENAGLSGMELEKAAAFYHEQYRERRRTGEGRLISLPLAQIEELKRGALERLTQISSQIAWMKGEQATRLRSVQSKLLGFAADAENTLELTRKALVEYVRDNWEREEQEQARVSGMFGYAAKNGVARGNAANGWREEGGGAKTDGKRVALLVSLGSPHCNVAAAMIQKLGMTCITVHSHEELGELMRSGVSFDIAFVLAREDLDDLARIGYCLGMLHLFLGKGKTCLLVEQNALAINMRAFARELRLHFYDSPQECEVMMELVAGIQSGDRGPEAGI